MRWRASLHMLRPAVAGILISAALVGLALATQLVAQSPDAAADMLAPQPTRLIVVMPTLTPTLPPIRLLPLPSLRPRITQIAPTPTPTNTPISVPLILQVTVTPFTPMPTYPVAPWFRAWWNSHDGNRLLGSPIGPATTVDGWPAQLYEKGRVEDHSAAERDPNWRIMYGLVVDDLVNRQVGLPVGGDRSTVNYATLAAQATEYRRLSPPDGFAGGTWRMPDGSVFVPYDAALSRAPGHTIPPMFWYYINRDDLFPGGWLHDIGLPMTEPISAVVDKGDMLGRPITVQAFQRTILTYDAANSPEWRVERANVGTDSQR